LKAVRLISAAECVEEISDTTYTACQSEMSDQALLQVVEPNGERR